MIFCPMVSSKMPFSFEFMLLFLFGSVCDSVHRTSGSNNNDNNELLTSRTAEHFGSCKRTYLTIFFVLTSPCLHIWKCDKTYSHPLELMHVRMSLSWFCVDENQKKFYKVHMQLLISYFHIGNFVLECSSNKFGKSSYFTLPGPGLFGSNGCSW